MPGNSPRNDLPSVRSGSSIRSVKTDNTDETYYIEVEPDGDHRLSTAIVEGLAAITDTDPFKFDPLGDRIDPDHLDKLFESLSEPEHGKFSVSFSYAGYWIVVSDTTHITVTSLP